MYVPTITTTEMPSSGAYTVPRPPQVCPCCGTCPTCGQKRQVGPLPYPYIQPTTVPYNPWGGPTWISGATNVSLCTTLAWN